jgi:hypothetical protein
MYRSNFLHVLVFLCVLCVEILPAEKLTSKALTQRTRRKTRARRNPAHTELLRTREHNFLARAGLRIAVIGRMKLNMGIRARMRDNFAGNLVVDP